MTITVAVGSTNVDKIEATKQAFERLPEFDDFRVVSARVESGVRHQPMSASEALAGAENRASNARHGQATYGVGIEGGLMLVDSIWFNVAFVCVQRVNYLDVSTSFGISNGVPVPTVLMEKILAGGELSFAVDEVLDCEGMKNRGGWHGVFTMGQIGIPQAIEDAIFIALCGFKLDEQFGNINFF